MSKKRGRRVADDDDDDDYVPPPKLPREQKERGGATGQQKKKLKVAEADSIEFLLEDEAVTFKDYSSELVLKPDHEKRPIWITKDNLIYLEAFSPLYQLACDFLVTIAEPKSRPEFIHIYELTQNSLYAAVAVSLPSESIVKVLSTLCKTNIPREVIGFIKSSTETFGKAKLVLKDNNYFVESSFKDVLKALLENETIKAARQLLDGNDALIESSAPVEDRRAQDYTRLAYDMMDVEEEVNQENTAQARTFSFMVRQSEVQRIKRSAKDEAGYPLMEEYDFINDRRNKNLVMDLRASTKIRPYQEKSLSKMFGNGRARSGIIVLPCGAGKSLTGVTAASTVKKSTIVMCINNASVNQWRQEFIKWTNVSADRVKLFTSSLKEDLPADEACVVITTYSMISHGGERSAASERMIAAIRQREWGLMILDEVHVAPARMFKEVVRIINAHCKLGLTATLVREDDKIQDLAFIVGPKLYEANWIDLTSQGFLAKVKCSEVWCPMTKEFYAEYIRRSTGGQARLQRLLYTLNPTKFRVCEHLVRVHRDRGDKIIIFSDDVPALDIYCRALKPMMEVPYIYGGTSESERSAILELFKTSPDFVCLGLSKVGDTALDIPEANVIIQVSSHFGARRQEAQRLGRILRPKPNPTGDYNAFFYSLVSTDTKEMFFSSKRQQYLIDQGYTFHVRQDLAEVADRESQILKTKKQEVDLLNKVITFSDFELDRAEEKGLGRARQGEVDEDAPVVMHRNQSIAAITGAGGAVYQET